MVLPVSITSLGGLAMIKTSLLCVQVTIILFGMGILSAQVILVIVALGEILCS